MYKTSVTPALCLRYMPETGETMKMCLKLNKGFQRAHFSSKTQKSLENALDADVL